MGAALEAGGITIGILAENLLKKSVERTARYAISDGRLLLISPCHPDAHFTVGTAMSRNKLIYAMADYGLVVSAEHKKGGTWAGAEEELKRETSRPVFVRVENRVAKGNIKLIDIGAVAWPKSIEEDNLKQQLSNLAGKKKNQKGMSIFDFKARLTEKQKKVE
jgi:predicted Rossmann fold nucleotide-binding protein DprA/Smf involved in DNA uptake